MKIEVCEQKSISLLMVCWVAVAMCELVCECLCPLWWRPDISIEMHLYTHTHTHTHVISQPTSQTNKYSFVLSFCFDIFTMFCCCLLGCWLGLGDDVDVYWNFLNNKIVNLCDGNGRKLSSCCNDLSEARRKESTRKRKKITYIDKGKERVSAQEMGKENSEEMVRMGESKRKRTKKFIYSFNSPLKKWDINSLHKLHNCVCTHSAHCMHTQLVQHADKVRESS